MSKLTQQYVSRRQWLKGVALLGLGAGLSACGAATPAAKPGAGSGVKDLKIMWAQWDPANYLQQLVQDYEKEAGVKVTVIQEPWGSFLNRVSADWAAKGTSFDMVVGDSQWIGQAATQGHYVDLTDWMKGKGIDKTVTPATLQYYGTYNGKYYAFPTEGDALGWAYRKDLFEDPKEKEAFKAKYGYDLGIPADIVQLRDIAEFFTRKDKNLYGIAVYTQKDYDAITMGAQNFIFAYGGDWGEKINSDGAVKGLDMYRSLYQFAPPGLSNAFFQELNDAFISGQVAMITNYFAFFPALVNPSINKNYADKVGFFSTPKGPGGQFASLGGQGVSINAYIADDRKEASRSFIEWFARKDVQEKWAKLGGYTCNIEVLKSDAFLKSAPYNPAFAETMTFVKDFYNNPVFGDLLVPAQREFSKYVVDGQGSAKEALDTIKKEHDAILAKAGLK